MRVISPVFLMKWKAADHVRNGLAGEKSTRDDLGEKVQRNLQTRDKCQDYHDAASHIPLVQR